MNAKDAAEVGKSFDNISRLSDTDEQANAYFHWAIAHGEQLIADNDRLRKRVRVVTQQLDEANRDIAGHVCGPTKSSDALGEALLQVKTYREHAEAADSKATGLQIKLNKLDETCDRLRKDVKGAEFALQQAQYENKRLRAQLKELQDELDPNTDPPRVEVISFIDDCGHSVVINATGTAQKLKVYRGLIRDAMEQGVLKNNEHYNYDELLKTGTVEELMGAISDSYISTGGCSREGFDAVPTCDEWPGADLNG